MFICRVHPSLYQFSKQDKVELYVDVYKYQIKESLKALDDFVTQMKLSSHSDAIEILALHCGMRLWTSYEVIDFSVTRIQSSLIIIIILLIYNYRDNLEK